MIIEKEILTEKEMLKDIKKGLSELEKAKPTFSVNTDNNNKLEMFINDEKYVLDRIPLNSIAYVNENLENSNSIYSIYISAASWTPVIKYVVETAIGKMGRVNPEDKNREYYRLDSIFWTGTYKQEDKDDNYVIKIGDSALNIYKWKLNFAIEYENSNKDWTDELIKLAHLRCNMKILITYSQLEAKTEYQELIAKKMEYAQEMLAASSEEALQDKWLIIFLPTERFDVDKMIGYNMEGGHFKRIKADIL